MDALRASTALSPGDLNDHRCDGRGDQAEWPTQISTKIIGGGRASGARNSALWRTKFLGQLFL
jgi:hypothetical protein